MNAQGSKKLSIPEIAMLMMNMISTSMILAFSRPFLPQMIRYFGYEEYQKGYFAGLIQTAFYAGRIFGCIIIGRIADKISKYRVFMVCLLLSSIFTILFGLALNIYFVIAMKFFIGLVSGTALLGNAIVYDLCTNENQSFGMMFHMMGIAIGTVIAFNIGGNLINPAKLYPSVFEHTFLSRYPYLLSCLVVVCEVLINIVLIYFVEKSINGRSRSSSGGGAKKPPKESTLKTYGRILRSKKIIYALGTYMLFSICAVGIDELLVIYISTEVSLGGLGYSTQVIGRFLMYCAIPGIAVNILVFTKIIKKIGIIGVIKGGTFILLPVNMIIPISYLLSTRISPQAAEIFIYIEYIIIMSTTNMLFGPIGLLLNNSVDFHDIGTVNGIGLSLSCLSRAIAPVLFDSIYASSIGVKLGIGKVVGSLVSFSVVSVFILVLVILCFLLPTSLNSRKQNKKMTAL